VKNITINSADADFERGRVLQEEVMERIERFRAGDRLGRDEIHGRDAASLTPTCCSTP